MDSFEVFAELFVSLFWLCDKRVSSSSEDLKANSVESAYNLIKYSNISVIQKALNDELFVRALSHAVSVLVSLPIEESSKSLKISSLKTLEILLLRSHSVVVKDESQATVIRRTWKEFLPGISISILKLLTMDDKHPQGLIKCSLNVLSLLLTACFPRSLEEDIKNSSSTDEFKKTCQNLKMIVVRLSKVFLTNRWTSVKFSLLSLATSIITETSPSFLEHLHEVLFEIPITLSCDTDEEVKSKATSFIHTFLQEETSSDYKERLQESLEEKAMLSMKALEETIESLSAVEKLQQLQFLSGVLQLLDQQLFASFMSFPNNRNQLLRFLFSMIKVSSSTESFSVMASAKHGITDTGRVELTHFPVKEDPNALPVLVSLIKSLAKKMAFETLQDFINCFRDRKSTESIFLLNCLLEDVCNQDDILWSHIEWCSQILKDIAEETTRREIQMILSISKANQTNADQKHSFVDQENQTILSLEGILVCVPRVVGKPALMLSIAHIVMKFLSSSWSAVVCHRVLDTIASRLNYKSKSHFFRENVSFFTLKMEEEYIRYSTAISCPGLPRDLHSLFLVCGEATEDTNVSSALLSLTNSMLEVLDSCYSLKPTFIFQGLLVIVSSLVREEKMSETRSTRAKDVKGHRQSFLKLEDFRGKWQDFLESKKAAEQDPMESKEDDSATGHIQDDDQMQDHHDNIESGKTKELSSPKLKMSYAILERVSKLLSTPDVSDRMTVINIISKCCLVLCSEEDTLLPLIHRLWRQIVIRLKDDDSVVALTAFQFLDTLSNVCGDFVRQRMSSDVLPNVCSFLTKHVKDSLNTGHKFTMTFKYQLHALEKLGSIVVGLELDGHDLWKVIRVLIPYVSFVQPMELREASVSSLKTICELDRESVWFCCHERLKECRIASNQRDIPLLASFLQ